MFIGGDMVKLKEENCISQILCITDFVLVLNSVFTIDQIQEFSLKEQTKEIENFHSDKWVDFESTCVPLTKRLQHDARDFLGSKNLDRFDESGKTVLFPFSKGYCNKTKNGHINGDKYLVNELIDWVDEKYNLDELNTPNWINNYINNRHEPSALIKDDRFIEINTLPKVIQLMIGVCNNPEYDTTKPNYSETDVIKKLRSKAVSMNIYLKDNARKHKALGDLKNKKIITFIQKDNK